MKHRKVRGSIRTWGYKLLALTVVPTFLLLSLEGGLRLFGYGYPTHFFVPAPSGEGHVLNHKFGWRFFPRNVSRKPPPLHLAEKKPQHSYRIFVLGGSAALGDPAPEAGFARMLEVLLEEQYPDINFQVITAAMVAINSHVVVDIARDCADFDGDLFVIYMGNNEVVGPFGPSSVLLTEQPSRQIIRAISWLKSTRVGQLMVDTLALVQLGDSDPGKAWTGMEMYLEHRIADSDPRLEWVYENFRDNLAAITETTLATGAKTLVCTVPVNVRDNPPFASVHRPGLSAAEKEHWEQLYQDGLSLHQNKRYESSVVKYREALAIDDRHAELHFRLARSLLKLAGTEAARGHFLAALQLDALRFRADRRVNEIIREVSTGRESEGLHLMDLEKTFQGLPETNDGLPGDESFHEHVHLNFAGNYAAARALAKGISLQLPDSIRQGRNQDTKWASPQRCAELLPWTLWDRIRVQNHLKRFINKPPFTHQLGSEVKRTTIDDLLAHLKSQITPAAMASVGDRYREAVGRSPDSPNLRMLFARWLMRSGKYHEALEQLKKLEAWFPHNGSVLTHMARVQLHLAGLATAEPFFKRAVEVRPRSSDLHFLYAKALENEKRPGDALELLRKLDEELGGKAPIEFVIAGILWKQKKPGEAIRELRSALKLEPKNANMNHRMGTFLESRGQIEQAIECYRRALSDGKVGPPARRRLKALSAASAGASSTSSPSE